ncbi:MAG: alpha/beta fold hydrolase [Alphaproteobacteria bacterium]|nr:alpha/beta fold hydrolase [Alphaproteobacteria bacterium]
MSSRRWFVWAGIGVAALAVPCGAGAALSYLSFRPDPAALPPATVADDPSLPFIELEGRRMHGESFGDPDGRVVIVLHGGPGGDYRNLLVLKALADDGYLVVFYDQMGSGLSPRDDAERATFDGMLAELDAVVDHYGKGRSVALVGHSWGGMLTAYYLARHPEKVARAVMAEPGVLTTEEYQEFLGAMSPSMSGEMVSYMARTWFESLHVTGPDEYAARDYLVQQVMKAPMPGNAMNRYWCGGVAPEAAYESWRVGAAAMQAVQAGSRQEDGSFAMPPLEVGYPGEVLLIASSCNTMIGVQRQTAHLEHFPNARLVVIEDAGHLMFTDQPEASLATLREYLAQWPD